MKQSKTSPKPTKIEAGAATAPTHVDASAGAGTLRRNPHLEGVLAVIDFVLAYLFFASALDTGSWLQYGFAIVAFALGVRSASTVLKAIRQKRGKRDT
jgi:hypothetical protein